MKHNIKIISGGQTGVDLIALRLAYAHGFKTGGYATNEYINEDGSNISESIRLGMIPINCRGNLSLQYRKRNERNIIDSDLCIVFSLYDSPGTNLSLRLIEKYNKDYEIIDDLNSVDIDRIIETIIDKSHLKSEYIINFIGHRKSKLNDLELISISDIIQNILCSIE